MFVLLAAAVLLTSNTYSKAADDGPLRNVKPFALTTSATWDREVRASLQEDAFERIPLYPPSFSISQALDGLLEHVNRDFINSWYTKVSPDPSFSLQVENLVRHTIIQVFGRVQTVDVTEVLVGKITPLLTTHLHDFSAAERAVRGKHLNIKLTESEELDLAIASKYRNGKLHAAAGLGFSDMKQAQQDHLRKLVDKVLPLILPANEIKSRAVCIIAREIIACGVLFPALAMLSDPDSWNRIIEVIVCFPDPSDDVPANSCLLFRLDPHFRTARLYASFEQRSINMQLLIRQTHTVTRAYKVAVILTIINL